MRVLTKRRIVRQSYGKGLRSREVLRGMVVRGSMGEGGGGRSPVGEESSMREKGPIKKGLILG